MDTFHKYFDGNRDGIFYMKNKKYNSVKILLRKIKIESFL